MVILGVPKHRGDLFKLSHAPTKATGQERKAGLVLTAKQAAQSRPPAALHFHYI